MPEEAELVMGALSDVTASGVLTPDLGGDATTTECGAAVRHALRVSRGVRRGVAPTSCPRAQ